MSQSKTCFSLSLSRGDNLLPTASSAKSKYYHYTPTVARIRALAMPSWWDVWDIGVCLMVVRSHKKEKKAGKKSSYLQRYACKLSFQFVQKSHKKHKKADFTMRCVLRCYE